MSRSETCLTLSACDSLRRHESKALITVIRVYDEAGNVIETRKHKGEFKE
jgi:hypothetical protein